mgnify:CR=1 FL=1
MSVKAVSNSTPGWISQLIAAASDVDDQPGGVWQRNTEAAGVEALKYASQRNGANGRGVSDGKAHKNRDLEIVSVASGEPAYEQATSHQSSINFDQLTKTIAVSAAALKKLTSQTETISANAENRIASLNKDLAAERSLVHRLQSELEASKAENARVANDCMRRFKEFETLVGSLKEKLANSTHELEVAKQWLDYLNNQINSDLLDAVSEAEKALKKPLQAVQF